MAGKLIVYAPDEDMGRRCCSLFLDDEKCATLHRGDVFTIDIEKDCKLQTQEYMGGIPLGFKSKPYFVKDYLSTELDLLPGIYTPVERQLIVLDKEKKEQIDAENEKEQKELEKIAKEVADAVAWERRERRMRCNVCGHIFCYTYDDIKSNNTQRLLAGLSALGSLASVAVGSRYDMYEQSKNMDRQSAKVKDFSHCPHCNSTSIQEITEEDIHAAQAKPAPTLPDVNVVDELKKYKELLDMCIITQEEFDAKKKQLLGL